MGQLALGRRRLNPEKPNVDRRTAAWLLHCFCAHCFCQLAALLTTPLLTANAFSTSAAMRAATRLLASVRNSARYLEPNAPTGLCGLLTHPSPRSTLLLVYRSTLADLQQLPATSVYRQATEALTKKRLEVLERIKPDGIEAFEQHTQDAYAKHPEAFRVHQLGVGDQATTAIEFEDEEETGRDGTEWDGESVQEEAEGLRSVQEREDQTVRLQEAGQREEPSERPQLDPEPVLTAEQYVDGRSAAWLEAVADQTGCRRWSTKSELG